MPPNEGGLQAAPAGPSAGSGPGSKVTRKKAPMKKFRQKSVATCFPVTGVELLDIFITRSVIETQLILEPLVIAAYIQQPEMIKVPQLYQTKLTRKHRHLQHCPILHILSVMRSWANSLAAGRGSQWCNQNGFASHQLEEIESSVISMWGKLKRHCTAGNLQFSENVVETDNALQRLVVTVWHSEIYINRGPQTLGYAGCYQKNLINWSGCPTANNLPKYVVCARISSTREAAVAHLLCAVNQEHIECLVKGNIVSRSTLNKWEELTWQELVYNNLGRSVQDKLSKLLDSEGRSKNGLIQRLESACNGQRPLVSQSVPRASLRVFAPTTSVSYVSALLDCVLAEIKTEVREELSAASLSPKGNFVKLFMGAGGVIKDLVNDQPTRKLYTFVPESTELKLDDFVYDMKYSFNLHFQEIEFPSKLDYKRADCPEGFVLYRICTLDTEQKAVRLLETFTDIWIGKYRFQPYDDSPVTKAYETETKPRVVLEWKSKICETGRARVQVRNHKDVRRAVKQKSVTVGRSKAAVKSDMTGACAFYLVHLHSDVTEEEVEAACCSMGVCGTDVKVERTEKSLQELRNQFECDMQQLEKMFSNLEKRYQFNLQGNTVDESSGTFEAILQLEEPADYFSLKESLNLLDLKGLKVNAVLDRLCRITLCEELYNTLKDSLAGKFANLQSTYGSKLTFHTRAERSTISIDIQAANIYIYKSVVGDLEQVFEPTILRLKEKDLEICATTEGKQQIDALSKGKGCYIEINHMDKLALVFGAKKKKRAALVDLKVLFRSPTKTAEFHVHFPRKMSSTLQADVQNFQQDPKHRILTLADDGMICSVDEKHLRMIMDKLVAAVNCHPGSGRVSLPECSLCFCEITRCAFDTSLCGHVFCHECIVGYVNVKVAAGQFPVSCPEENCDELICSSDFERLLPNRTDKTKLLTGTLAHYVSNSGRKLRFCITADCPGVYSATDIGVKMYCSLCQKVICSSCHVKYHEGMTCEEFRPRLEEINRLDEQMQKWASEDPSNRKLCPHCLMGIEKNGGCDCMHCVHCSSTICWQCMEIFDSSTECYEHMDQEHPDEY